MDLSKYKDSMRPLIERDIAETEQILRRFINEDKNSMLVVTDIDKSVELTPEQVVERMDVPMKFVNAGMH